MMSDQNGKSECSSDSLRELGQQILDPHNGVLIGASEVAGQGAAFRTPSGFYQRTYIDAATLFSRASFREPLLAVASSLLPNIARETKFSAVMTHTGVGAQLTYCLRDQILDSNSGTKFFMMQAYDTVSDHFPYLDGEKLLIVTDVVLTGHLVQNIAHKTMLAGAKPVAVLAMLDITPGIDSPDGPRVARLGMLSKYSLLRLPFSALRADTDNLGDVLSAEELHAGTYSDSPQVVEAFDEVNGAVKAYLARHPERVYALSPRQFEELIADILKDLGFEIQLTPATRDGGRDIIAWFRNAALSVLTYVECKKYSPERRVGVEVVRSLYGVHNMHKANKSLIVTTSFFTKDATKAAQHIGAPMELKDYDDLKVWLQRYKESPTMGST